MKLSIPYDVGRDRVESLVRRELQTCEIRSLSCGSDRVDVEVRAPFFSKLVRRTDIAGIPFIEATHHSAVLPAWMEVLRGKRHVRVVHVDSHSDLGSPNLVADCSGALRDRWTGAEVRASSIHSVRRAVDSSAIEIGSYLTAALFLLPIRAVGWLSTSFAGRFSGATPKGLALETSGPDALDSTVRRLHVKRTAAAADVAFMHKWRPSLAELAEFAQIDDASIVLDLDLDFFDNSDQCGADAGEPSAIELRMALFRELLRHLDGRRVAAISIAHSPGFCPAPVASRFAGHLPHVFSRWLDASRKRAR